MNQKQKTSMRMLLRKQTGSACDSLKPPQNIVTMMIGVVGIDLEEEVPAHSIWSETLI